MNAQPFLQVKKVSVSQGIQEGGPKTTISDSFFVNNVSQGNGGGLFVAGTLATVSDSTFNGNTAVNGAGIEANAATFSLSDSTVASDHTLATNGGTGGSGGGLDVSTGADAVTVANDLFLNNTANNAGMATGGGINLAVGALDLFNSQFTGNAANTGGALNFAGITLMASGNTFNNNRSTIGGGALNFEGTGTLRANNGSQLTNNTFVPNATAGNGGAILDAGPGDLVLLNETINGNLAQNNGGGVALTGPGTLSFQNTIVALNTADGMGNDVFTGTGFTVTDHGGNLIGTTVGSTGYGPATLTGKPRLNPLENNGGQFAGAPNGRQVVQTESLLPGSPAFDKGIMGSSTIDKRGFPRPGTGNTTVSIGAYEPQYASNASPAQIFVDNAFEVLLNRRADNGAGFFVDLLNHGATPNAVVQLIESSQEYRTHEVQSVFDRYLHREADPGALQSFVNFLSGGGTVEQLTSVVVGSQEYYNIHGDSTDIFLEGLYLDSLGRLPDAAGETGLRYSLATGSSRTLVATMVFSSQEYLNNLVESDYQSILGRDADSPGLNFFVRALQTGTTDEMVLADLLGSGEGIFKRT